VDDLLSEKEQIEQIRSWWSEYGGYVIFGVAAGALLLFGINYYQNSKLAAQLEASSLYESLTNRVVDGDLDGAEAVADQLGTTFADTTYAAQAKLAIARLYMDKNRDQDAADVLDELLDSTGGDELKPVARLRLARILLYQDKPQEVVDLLEGQDLPSFSAAYGEALGDAYHALGRIADAQAAYQQVLMDPLSRGTVDQQLVQWKALDLPEVQPEEPAAEPAADETVEATESDTVEEVDE
jgi:predicted negative regulator of RcsB-dependent stress response